jgi:gamma-glutamylcyclotransferase (GGCT)/AIG2-like uncharacterized protein YtfP
MIIANVLYVSQQVIERLDAFIYIYTSIYRWMLITIFQDIKKHLYVMESQVVEFNR